MEDVTRGILLGKQKEWSERSKHLEWEIEWASTKLGNLKNEKGAVDLALEKLNRDLNPPLVKARR